MSLAASMQPVIDAIGFDAAVTLVSRFGGVTILMRARDDDPLTLALGCTDATTLAAALGPGAMYIPRCMHWLLAKRNEEICARYLHGEPQSDLALRYRLSDRHIRNILASEPATGASEADFFGAEEGAQP